MKKSYVINVLIAIIGAVGFVLFYPWLFFWFSYFGGCITKIVIGDKLVAALNILFNTNYFNVEMIPMMSGALGWISGFFKVFNNNNSNRTN